MNFRAFGQHIGVGKTVNEVKDLFRAYNIHMDDEEDDMPDEPTFIEPIVEMTYDESDTESNKLDFSGWGLNSDHWKAKQQLLELESIYPSSRIAEQKFSKCVVKKEPIIKKEVVTVNVDPEDISQQFENSEDARNDTSGKKDISSLLEEVEQSTRNYEKVLQIYKIRKKRPNKSPSGPVQNDNEAGDVAIKKKTERAANSNGEVDDTPDPAGAHRCDLCGATFRIKFSITKHKRVIHGVHQFSCMFCQESYPLKRNLLDHIPTHRGPHGFRCNVCNKVRPNYASIQRHVKTHAEKSIPCPQCTAWFKTKWELKSHAIQHLKVRKFKCEICALTFLNPSKLREHMTRHKGPCDFVCEICFKELATQQSLNNHRKLHFDEKPFKCQYCSLSFYTLSARKKHAEVHAKEISKPFECTDCSKKYTSSTSLAVHRLKYHAGDKLFSCHHCDGKFSSKTAIANHLLTHERPHSCQHCLCRYKNKRELRRHQRSKGHGGAVVLKNVAENAPEETKIKEENYDSS